MCVSCAYAQSKAFICKSTLRDGISLKFKEHSKKCRFSCKREKFSPRCNILNDLTCINRIKTNAFFDDFGFGLLPSKCRQALLKVERTKTTSEIQSLINLDWKKEWKLSKGVFDQKVGILYALPDVYYSFNRTMQYY